MQHKNAINTVVDSLKCRYVPLALIKHALFSIIDCYAVIHVRALLYS